MSFYDESGRVIKIRRSEEEWRRILTPVQYRILREKGTDPPLENEYFGLFDEGEYDCAGCGLPLFSSEDKMVSCSGWPSFKAPMDPRHIEEIRDRSLGMVRVEAVCARCGSHLGHIFDDGPPPTGRRY